MCIIIFSIWLALIYQFFLAAAQHIHEYSYFFRTSKIVKHEWKKRAWIELKRAVKADDVCPVDGMLWMKYAFSHRIWIDIKMFLNFNFQWSPHFHTFFFSFTQCCLLTPLMCTLCTCRIFKCQLCVCAYLGPMSMWIGRKQYYHILIGRRCFLVIRFERKFLWFLHPISCRLLPMS